MVCKQLYTNYIRVTTRITVTSHFDIKALRILNKTKTTTLTQNTCRNFVKFPHELRENLVEVGRPRALVLDPWHLNIFLVNLATPRNFHNQIHKKEKL